MPLTVNTPDPNFLGGFLGGDLFGQQVQTANQNNALNQQGMLQDLYKQQQMMPSEIAQSRLGNISTLADIYNKEQTGRSLKTSADFGEATNEAAIKAKLAELATSLSDSEWKQSENGIKQLMVSPSENERKIGQMLYQYMPDMVKSREEAAARTAQAREVALIGERRALAVEAKRAQTRVNIENEKRKYSTSKDPDSLDKLAASLASKAFAAQREGDNESAAEYLAQSNAIQQQANAIAAWRERVKQENDPNLKDLKIDVRGTPKEPPPLVAPPKAGQPVPPPVPVAPPNPLNNNPTVPPSQHENAASEIYKKAFGSYEPDKYMYRISPEGKPQRKLK